MANHFYQAADSERAIQDGISQPGEHRSAFQMDRDRIIHSGSFRHLQNKTQVFFSGEYDFYRTRLTHSIEVAQIGRSLCDYLNRSSELLGPEFFIDSDLVEACCLAHDIGHPPFGHTGERALHRLMSSWGGFEGNAQTLRILVKFHFHSNRGMNPTRALIGGILKYKTLYGEVQNQKNHFLYPDQASLLDFALMEQEFPDSLPPGKERNSFRSIECQIMDWADDTAYSLHDITDGVEAGFINTDRLSRWAEATELTPHQEKKFSDLCAAIRERRVEPIIGRKIGEFIRAAQLHPVPHGAFLSDLTSRHAFYLAIDPAIREECDLYKKIAFDLVFQSQQLQQLDWKYEHILNRLFEVLADLYIYGSHPGEVNFHLLSQEDEARLEFCSTEADRARIICDTLARMTDGVATRTYRRLFDANFGSILDFV